MRLSIRGKIVRLPLQDMDSMVRTAMAIKGEIDDAKSIRDMATGRRKEVSLLRARECGGGLLFPEDYKDRVTTIKTKARAGARAR